MDFSRIICTRRTVYTFANGVRSTRYYTDPLVLIALPANREPPTEAERGARRIRAEQRRVQTILRAEEREAERQRHERELEAARHLEIQQAAQDVVNREIDNLRREFQAEINRIRTPDEVEIIAIMPRPQADLDGIVKEENVSVPIGLQSTLEGSGQQVMPLNISSIGNSRGLLDVEGPSRDICSQNDANATVADIEQMELTNWSSGGIEMSTETATAMEPILREIEAEEEEARRKATQ